MHPQQNFYYLHFGVGVLFVYMTDLCGEKQKYKAEKGGRPHTPPSPGSATVSLLDRQVVGWMLGSSCIWNIEIKDSWSLTFILNISDRLWKKGITQLLNSKVKSFQSRLEIFNVMVFGILDGFLHYIKFWHFYFENWLPLEIQKYTTQYSSL